MTRTNRHLASLAVVLTVAAGARVAAAAPDAEGSPCGAVFDRTSCGPGLLCVEYRCLRIAPSEPAPRAEPRAPRAEQREDEMPSVTARVAPVAAAERRHTIALNSGFASAVGLVGLTYAYRPRPWLELEAGLGWGFSGLQFSLMPRLSVGSDAHRLVAGIGLSASVPVGSAPLVETPALWLNVDLIGYELRARGGFFLMVAAGGGVGLAGGRYGIDDEAEQSVRGLLFVQGRVAIGWSF